MKPFSGSLQQIGARAFSTDRTPPAARQWIDPMPYSDHRLLGLVEVGRVGISMTLLRSTKRTSAAHVGPIP